MRLTVFFALMWISVLGHAQAVFDEDLSAASARWAALMVRAERAVGHSDSGRLQVRRELLDLEKSLHRVEEDAMRADLELTRNGKKSDTALLRAASVAASLALASSLTGYYLSTTESSFKSAARSAAQIARDLQSTH